jgi:hypothetical protein
LNHNKKERKLRQDKHTPGFFRSWSLQKGNRVEFWLERERLRGVVEAVNGDTIFIRTGTGDLFERQKEQVRKI